MMLKRSFITAFSLGLSLGAQLLTVHASPDSDKSQVFIDKYCADCHDDSADNKSGLDLSNLGYTPNKTPNFLAWIKVHDRVSSGEMPPKKKQQPSSEELTTFISDLKTSLLDYEKKEFAKEGRSTRRRMNGYEYENALRDILHAPWLQIRGQLPDDGEINHFNKSGEALDVSHVHMSRLILAADYAIKQALSVKYSQPATKVVRYYARDQKTLTSKFSQDIFNTSNDRQTYPLIGLTPQTDVRTGAAELTVGESNPEIRNKEAVAWVSSNYVTGFTYRWDSFRAPVAGKYKISFNGYTLWVGPGGSSRRFKDEKDTKGTVNKPSKLLPNFDDLHPGRRNEPITVYTRNGISNRRVGEFDLSPQDEVHDIGEVWLLANETLVPDASRFYRSRPNNFRNPLMQADGAPSVAFQWMDVEGPLYDKSTTLGYERMFSNLPLRKTRNQKAGVAIPTIAVKAITNRRGAALTPLQSTMVEVVTQNPVADAEKLLRSFLNDVYRTKATEDDVQLFLGLIKERMHAGLSFTEAMVAGYTAVLVSPKFLYIDEKPGHLDDTALATRLSLFLWNSIPDKELLQLAESNTLHEPSVLHAQTERLLNDTKAERFMTAFLDYWLDLRKIEDSTPSATLYNDYYLDDSLEEAAVAETQLYFKDMVVNNLPAKTIVASHYTYLNERLAEHYGIAGVKGIAMRKVDLPESSPRGGIITQASVLKITANGTTTSPVIRGKWIMERILGYDVPPPPPVVPAVEPDIRGAVTIRQQLDKHRIDKTCASCHSKIDPAGFALENFDVMGAWRDRYRAVSDDKAPIKGIGKNGQPFAFCYALPIDASGQLSDGNKFKDINDFRQILLNRQTVLATNIAKQLLIYSTGTGIHFSDRQALDAIVKSTQRDNYGVRSLIHAVIQSSLFQTK